MKCIFGVCSTAPANKRLKNGYTLYDWVMRKRCFPAFWGRPLLGEQAVTTEELEFLTQKDCRVALMISDLTEAGVSAPSGKKDALRAVNAAKKLGVPQNSGIALFAEIHPEWSINHNWMISFARTVLANGYLPGFIGNTDSSDNFNFDRQCSHYVHATKEQKQFGAIYWATAPKQSKMPKEWSPYCPSALKPEEMHLWSPGKSVFDDISLDEIYARDEKVLECMWERRYNKNE